MDENDLQSLLIRSFRNAFEKDPKDQAKLRAGDSGAVAHDAALLRAEAQVALNAADRRLQLFNQSDQKDTYSLQETIKGYREGRDKLSEAIRRLESLTEDPHEQVLKQAGIQP